MIWSNLLPLRFSEKAAVSEPVAAAQAESPCEKPVARVKGRAHPASAMGALMNLVASQAGGCQLTMVAPKVAPKVAPSQGTGFGGPGSAGAEAAEKRWIAWVAAPYMPSAAALSAMGIDPASLLFIHARDEEHAVWVMEQALRSGTCAAVFAWLPHLEPKVQARLQQAAQCGNAWGTLLHDVGFHEAEQAERESERPSVGQRIAQTMATTVATTTAKAAVKVRQSVTGEGYTLQLDF